jgi:hypothetical protein
MKTCCKDGAALLSRYPSLTAAERTALYSRVLSLGDRTLVMLLADEQAEEKLVDLRRTEPATHTWPSRFDLLLLATLAAAALAFALTSTSIPG